jgi:hypothetical protein
VKRLLPVLALAIFLASGSAPAFHVLVDCSGGGDCATLREVVEVARNRGDVQMTEGVLRVLGLPPGAA